MREAPGSIPGVSIFCGHHKQKNITSFGRRLRNHARASALGGKCAGERVSEWWVQTRSGGNSMQNPIRAKWQRKNDKCQISDSLIRANYQFFNFTYWDMLARSGRAPACTGALRARSSLNGRAPGRASACTGALRAHSGLERARAGRSAPGARPERARAGLSAPCTRWVGSARSNTSIKC